MGTWNYRVFKEPEDGSLTIHEVYYNDDGSMNGWTATPVNPVGDTPDELMSTLVLMREALARPVLEVRDGKLCEASPAPRPYPRRRGRFS